MHGIDVIIEEGAKVAGFFEGFSFQALMGFESFDLVCIGVSQGDDLYIGHVSIRAGDSPPISAGDHAHGDTLAGGGFSSFPQCGGRDDGREADRARCSECGFDKPAACRLGFK